MALAIVAKRLKEMLGVHMVDSLALMVIEYMGKLNISGIEIKMENMVSDQHSVDQVTYFLKNDMLFSIPHLHCIKLSTPESDIYYDCHEIGKKSTLLSTPLYFADKYIVLNIETKNKYRHIYLYNLNRTSPGGLLKPFSEYSSLNGSNDICITPNERYICGLYGHRSDHIRIVKTTTYGNNRSVNCGFYFNKNVNTIDFYSGQIDNGFNPLTGKTSIKCTNEYIITCDHRFVYVQSFSGDRIRLIGQMYEKFVPFVRNNMLFILREIREHIYSHVRIYDLTSEEQDCSELIPLLQSCNLDEFLGFDVCGNIIQILHRGGIFRMRMT